MKKDILITVFNKQQYDGDDWPPSEAKDFMDWFAGKINSIPVEFRDSAKVRLDTESSHGDYYVGISIKYWRKETDEEMLKRESDELNKLRKKEEAERLLLEKLREKYERPKT